MIKKIGAEIYIELPLLVLSGTSEKYLKVALHRNRTGETNHFKHISDPDDARRKLFSWQHLPDGIKQKVIAAHGNPEQTITRQPLTDLLKNDPEATRFFRTYKLDDGASLSEDHVQQYSTAACWLNVLVEADTCKHFKKKYGITREEFYDAVSKIIKEQSLPLPANYSNLRTKLRQYKADGYAAIISKKFGNRNSNKLDEVQRAFLRSVYANPDQPQKLMYSQITWIYNQHAAQVGWQQVTEQTIYNYLSKPSTQMLCWKERNGKGVWRDQFDPVINRLRPSHPDDMWVMDGTPFELYYLDQNKARRMYAYFVVDACSWKVIGWDISESETNEVVMNALKMACCMTGHLPHQLQYDNSSANKSCEFLFRSIAKFCTPAGVGNARAKVIEPISKHINEQILKWFPNYSGANITAHKVDSHANRDLLQKQVKQLPSRAEVMHQIALAFQYWNLTPRAGEQTPDEIYAQGSPRQIELQLHDRLLLFGVYRRKPVTYTNEGIALVTGADRKLYWVDDEEFYLRHINTKFQIKYDPQDLSMIALYKDDRFVELAFEKELVPMARVDFDAKASATLQKFTQFKKKVAATVDEQIRHDAELITAETDAKLPINPQHRFKDITNAALQRIKQLEAVGFKEQHFSEQPDEDVQLDDFYGGTTGTMRKLDDENIF